MSDGQAGTPLNIAAAKKTGRDLMPIIVIFVFAIIMTVAAITIFNFINADPESAETVKHQEKLRQQDKIFNLMQQGTHALDHKNYDGAIRCFTEVQSILVGQDQPVLQFELNRYLAEAEFGKGNRALAKKYLETAESYRRKIRHYFDAEMNATKEKLKRSTGEKKP